MPSVSPAPAACALTSTFDPVPFFALLPAGEQALLNRLEFHDPPRVDLTAAGPSFADAATLHAEGKVALGRTRYRGTGINSLKMDVAFADGVFSARHVNLERDEGTATGDLVTYSLAKHEMRLDNVRSGLDLSQVGVWLDPDVYHTIQPFRFRRPPTLVMNGNLQFEGGRNSHLVTNVEAPGGMDYVFIKKTLPFKDIAGQVVFNEERMWLNDVHGEIFNGQAHGSLDLALGGKGGAHEYSAAMDFKDLDFARLTKLYFDYDSSKGQLFGNYNFTGRGTDERSLHGAGSLNVEHGNVFSIPFMGPLSPILNTLLPGLGFDEAHQASAPFLTDGGKIYLGQDGGEGTGLQPVRPRLAGLHERHHELPRLAEHAWVTRTCVVAGERPVRVQFAGAVEQAGVASTGVGQRAASAGREKTGRIARARRDAERKVRP